MSAGERGGAARSLGLVLSGAEPKKVRRTGQPVRRNSYHAGEREKRIWRSINPREIGPRLRAAEQYDRTHRQPGKRNGPLGHVGIEVLRELYRIVCFKSGRLEPSINYLERRLRRSRAAVVHALAALRRHGFLGWIRRTEPIEAVGPGPRVRQIPNAYWFDLPKTAMDLVRRLVRPAPAPVDDEERRAADAAELELMLSGLPLDEQMRMLIDNPQLAEALTRLGKHFDASNASSPNSQNPA